MFRVVENFTTPVKHAVCSNHTGLKDKKKIKIHVIYTSSHKTREIYHFMCTEVVILPLIHPHGTHNLKIVR